MRIFSVIVLILLVLIGGRDVAAEIKFEILKSGKTIQGIPFPEGTRIEYTEAGKIHYAILDRPEKIQDAPCEGWLYFYASGKLKSAQLARDYETHGFTFAKGTGIFFYESGKIQSGTIASAKNMGTMVFNSGARLNFYESGKLVDVFLAGEQEIQGILCGKGRVLFYDSGRIDSAQLAEDKEFGRIKVPKGSAIELYPSGKLKSVVLSGPTAIDGRVRGGGSSVSFTEDGKTLPLIVTH